MKNNEETSAEHIIESSRKQASKEFFANVEYHLYAQRQSTQLDADESDIVSDFAFQKFSAAACAQHITAQRDGLA